MCRRARPVHRTLVTKLGTRRGASREPRSRVGHSGSRTSAASRRSLGLSEARQVLRHGFILRRLLTICQYATLNLQYVQNASSCETPPTTITVLVDQELRNRLARTAAENERSLGAETRVALSRAPRAPGGGGVVRVRRSQVRTSPDRRRRGRKPPPPIAPHRRRSLANLSRSTSSAAFRSGDPTRSLTSSTGGSSGSSGRGGASTSPSSSRT